MSILDAAPAHRLAPHLGTDQSYEVQFVLKVQTDHPDDAIAQAVALIAEGDLVPQIVVNPAPSSEN